MSCVTRAPGLTTGCSTCASSFSAEYRRKRRLLFETSRKEKKFLKWRFVVKGRVSLPQRKRFGFASQTSIPSPVKPVPVIRRAEDPAVREQFERKQAFSRNAIIPPIPHRAEPPPVEDDPRYVCMYVAQTH